MLTTEDSKLTIITITKTFLVLLQILMSSMPEDKMPMLSEIFNLMPMVTLTLEVLVTTIAITVDSKLTTTIIIMVFSVRSIITMSSMLVETTLMLIEIFNLMLMVTLTLVVLAITIATMVDFKLTITIIIMEFQEVLLITMFSTLLEVILILTETY